MCLNTMYDIPFIPDIPFWYHSDTDDSILFLPIPILYHSYHSILRYHYDTIRYPYHSCRWTMAIVPNILMSINKWPAVYSVFYSDLFYWPIIILINVPVTILFYSVYSFSMTVNVYSEIFYSDDYLPQYKYQLL